MTILSRDSLAACYDFLAETPPFNKWGLPPSEDVSFRIIRGKDVRGWYIMRGDKPEIAISSACVKRTDTLTATMAHEICHLYEDRAGFSRPDVIHGKAFLKLAAQVCKHHGWDEALF